MSVVRHFLVVPNNWNGHRYAKKFNVHLVSNSVFHGHASAETSNFMRKW